MKFIIASLLLFPVLGFAGTIVGTVKDAQGNVLAYTSILIKGTAKGTTSNSKGIYSISVEKGKYILVCQHVGYQTVEKNVVVNNDKETVVDFVLQDQQYTMNAVEVKSGGEDPAYAIIRKAIEKRKDYENEIKKFECQVYIKGQMQLRNYPKKFFGQTVDFEDGDTSKRKIIFLSESIAKYSVEGDNRKTEVISTKVSGSSNGFGFSSPQIISFYNNIVSIGSGLNPRGFVSPIANNALNFYKYKFMGTFFENGKEISRIKVIPKRTYEPLFTGYINIIENEWRLQSVKLTLLKEQQMQLLDTLNIEQLYVPLKNTWVIKQQVIYPAGKFFGFDFFGNFLQVYDDMQLEPVFKKKFFDNTVLKFYDSSNKKTNAYWDSIRPIPLLESEARDYKRKDSLERVRKSPQYLDSLDKRRNKITLGKLFLTGQSFGHSYNKTDLSFEPLVKSFNSYNTVEGYVLSLSATFAKEYEGRKRLYIFPTIRYGLSNKHLNGYTSIQYNFGKKYFNSISFSGGSNVYQLNNAAPITASSNTVSTLFWRSNYMKIYQAGFARINYSRAFSDGFTVVSSLKFQNRQPLENTTNYSFSNYKNRAFTPNFPAEIAGGNFQRHQAVIASVSVYWRPGAKYLELPDRKIMLGSKYPTFRISLTQGINGILGSDVDYTKWKVSVNDNLNLKLGGRFSYKFEWGGFLNSNKTFTPDFTHFMGNQTYQASRYLSSFQLMPYYQFSNTNSLYSTGHVEYHLNGLLTNKIPVIKKLNWFLVVGANGMYMNKNAYFYEGFIGVENILKIMRVDYLHGVSSKSNLMTGLRFSIPLLFSQPADNE